MVSVPLRTHKDGRLYHSSAKNIVYIQSSPLIRTVLEMKIWIYWSESNSWIYFCIVLNKNWKIYWSEQSFTVLGPEDRWSSWGQLKWTTNLFIITKLQYNQTCYILIQGLLMRINNLFNITNISKAVDFTTSGQDC